ncbi:restriction endonuclease subunit S [Campylobacter lari]|uniref:restriction endonuclease subunit S n=1 Tax=Campylobacter lari TaxID=201 RepID=UPI0017EE6079|nr:restriction endonuclease subunit S [Campylobacter lari]ECP5284037.1 restriction endonuclease subunit S [Campylobacter lari]MCV3526385.1 restriction endonuclease subunit S [Campylobacter lari]
MTDKISYLMTNLPRGWEVKKLGDIVKLKNGFAFKSNLFCNDGIPIIRIKNIQNENIILDDLVFCNPSDYKNNLDNYLIFKNDILIAMSGATTGKIGLYNLNNKAYLNQRIGLLRIDNNILRKYIFWFLYCNSEKNLTNAFGAAQPNLSTEQIHNIKIPLPPLKEQERIVGILDESFANIDESIKILEQDLLNLDELMQSALQKAFNLLKDNAKENYQLPQGWEWKSLGEICEVIMGQSPNGNCIFDKDKNKDLIEFHQGKIAFSDKYINKSNFVTSDVRKIAKKNSVVLCVRAPVGEVNIASKNIAIGRGLCSLNGIKVNNEFLFFYLLTLKKYFNDNSTGSTFKAINVKIIKEAKIPLPPLQEQEQIASYLDELSLNIKDLKQNYQTQIKNLQELKKSLLDRAFKGRL